MRWFWLDRFTEFHCGKYAVAIKNVSLSDEPIDEYSPGRPYYPASLIIEGLAQVGGLLVAELSDFENRVVLAKINKSKFHFQAEPSEKLVYRSEIMSLQTHGAVVNGVATVDGRVQCEAELAFAYLDDRFKGVTLFEPATFCRLLRCLKLFDVGVKPDGSRLQVPPYMREAEIKALSV